MYKYMVENQYFFCIFPYTTSVNMIIIMVTVLSMRCNKIEQDIDGCLCVKLVSIWLSIRLESCWIIYWYSWCCFSFLCYYFPFSLQKIKRREKMAWKSIYLSENNLFIIIIRNGYGFFFVCVLIIQFLGVHLK